jgi:hypothetical protein
VVTYPPRPAAVKLLASPKALFRATPSFQDGADLSPCFLACLFIYLPGFITYKHEINAQKCKYTTKRKKEKKKEINKIYIKIKHAYVKKKE